MNTPGISPLSNSYLSAQFKGQHRQSNIHLRCPSFIYSWDGWLPKEEHNYEVGPSWSPCQQTRGSLPPAKNTQNPKKLVNLLLITNGKFPFYTCWISLHDCNQMCFTDLIAVSTTLMELLQVVFTNTAVVLLTYNRIYCSYSFLFNVLVSSTMKKIYNIG